MRITAAQSEVLVIDTDYPDPIDPYDAIFGPTRFRVALEPSVTVRFATSEMTIERDWRIFHHERLEYRPEFDEEHEAKFREWHDIPAGADGVKVDKKNELIKVSGYDVYSWKWLVICTGKDIAIEEEFIKGLAADRG